MWASPRRPRVIAAREQNPTDADDLLNLLLTAEDEHGKLGPKRVRDEVTTFDPNRLATGMDTVIVNGTVTLSGGELTGVRNGEVLRRPGG